MTRHDIAGRPVTRRSILGALGAATVAPSAVGSAGGTQGTGYTVTQDDACQPIEPVSYRDASVEEFYGYTIDGDEGRPWSANTPVDLAESDVSKLFLYEGPDGLSLVVLHDTPEHGDEETGGAATFTFRGLPEPGEWVVKDDPADASAEIWDDRSGDGWSVHWAWKGDYTDGGAFRGLGDGFSVEIEPAWGRDAEIDPLEPGTIDSWVVVSGDPEDPDRFELDLEQSVTIESGSCEVGQTLGP
jgi:hypothetical protein